MCERAPPDASVHAWQTLYSYMLGFVTGRDPRDPFSLPSVIETSQGTWAVRIDAVRYRCSTEVPHVLRDESRAFLNASHAFRE